MNGHISSADNNLGKMIKLLRLQNQWTQDKVADLLHISVPAFSKIETGLTTINMTRLKQIAKIFNTSAYHLLHSTKDMQSQEQQEELKKLEKQYIKKTLELVELQRLAIKLYEELHASRVKKKSDSNK
jgi:transcriptional regulator with XRE-family HTH domain